MFAYRNKVKKKIGGKSVFYRWFVFVSFRYKVIADSLYHRTDKWTTIVWNLFKWFVYAQQLHWAWQLRNITRNNASLRMCQGSPSEAGIQFHRGYGGQRYRIVLLRFEFTKSHLNRPSIPFMGHSMQFDMICIIILYCIRHDLIS